MKRLITNSEYVFAMATVGECYTDPKHRFAFKMSVHHGVTGRNGSYFKIYDGNSPKKESSTKLARIKFTSPEYEKHADVLPHWNLKDSEKRLLNDFLDSESMDSAVPMSVWDFAKFQWNKEIGFCSNLEGPQRLSEVQQAYLDGKFDTEENLSDHQYLPSYLTRPDYTKL